MAMRLNSGVQIAQDYPDMNFITKPHKRLSHAYIIKLLGAIKMVDWVWNVGAMSPDLAMNSTAIDLRYTLTFCRITRYWMESKKRSKNSFCRPKRWKNDV